jgi:hypothetical protein
MMINNFNIERVIKYIILGLVVLIATKYIPEHGLPTKELIMISATSAIAFSILDMVSPSVKVINKPNVQVENPKVQAEKSNTQLLKPIVANIPINNSKDLIEPL